MDLLLDLIIYNGSVLFGIIGGLALLMYSISLLSDSLGKISGSTISKILERTTNNPVTGLFVGTGTTFMTQSSSITMMTLIGLVNSGIMTFRQSVNVMLGSEIGTTMTAQLAAFDIGFAFLPLIAIGFFLNVASKNEKVKLAAKVIFSIGLLFVAMDFIKQGFGPIKDLQIFKDLIASWGVIPLYGILIGTLIAGVTQSSSATTSMVVALGGTLNAAGNPIISLEAGIALCIGANLGTCVLELIVGVGATRPAKRTALAQALINIIGILVFLPFLPQFTALVRLTHFDLQRQIANAHTIFNVIVSVMFIPFVGALVWFCEKIIPIREGELRPRHFFDEKMLSLAQLALRESEREVVRTAEKTLKMLGLSKDAMVDGKLDFAKEVLVLEDEVDDFCDETEKFIDRIHEEDLTERDKLWRIRLLRIITDVERVGDLCNNLAEFAIRKEKEEVPFSEKGRKDLRSLFEAVERAYSTAIEALKEKSKSKARMATEMEDEVDVLEKQLKKAHIKRMKRGICVPAADVLFTESLRNLERISDHADNIAYDVLETFL
ncbi:MAG: Na/Pi cotransporter family protein [Promethearchaeota archaeon]